MENDKMDNEEREDGLSRNCGRSASASCSADVPHNAYEDAEKRFQGVCPFCGEDGFDLVGLKNHIERDWCSIYDLVPTFIQLGFRR